MMFAGFNILKQETEGIELFVGGIPADASYNEIRTYFMQFGHLIDCRMKEDKLTNKFRGFAFIKYKDNTAAYQVLNRNHAMRGHVMEIKRATTKKENDQNIKSEMVRKIFIVPVNKQLNEFDILQYFSKFDSVEAINIKRKEGFGFVTFKSRLGVNAVLDSGDLHKIKGFKIECRQVIDRNNLKPQTHSTTQQPNQVQQMLYDLIDTDTSMLKPMTIESTRIEDSYLDDGRDPTSSFILK